MGKLRTTENTTGLPKELLIQLSKGTRGFSLETRNIHSLLEKDSTDLDSLLINYYKKFGQVLTRSKVNSVLHSLTTLGYAQRVSSGVYKVGKGIER